MIYAVEHALGVSLIQARSEESAVKKARLHFGTHAAPFSTPKDQEKEISWAKAMGASVIGVFLIFCLGTAQAAEVCTDKAEFVHFLQQHKLYKERDKIQAAMIAELKNRVADQDESINVLKKHTSSCDVLVEEYAAQHAALIQEAKDREWSLWAERGKGFAIGLGMGLAVLIFK